MGIITLNLPKEIEQRFTQLPKSKKAELVRLITAFISPPKRKMAQVMDDMAQYAQQQGLTDEKLNEILNEK